MALKATTLQELCTHGFGPLSLTADGDSWVATWDHRTATVRFDGAALAVESERAAQWPASDLAADEVAFRVAVALRSLELDRDELCTLRASADTDTVTASVWIDPTSASVVDLARAVRAAVALTDLGARALDQVRAALAAEEQARAAARQAVDVVEQARRSLLGTEASGPAATSGPPATPPGAPTNALPSGPPHGFVATHVAPAGGLRTWAQPDPSALEGPPVPAGTPLQVIERRGAWAHVIGEAGQTAWVDGRLLPG